MKLSIILSTFLSTFATTTTAPNLCDDVFLDASDNPVTDLVGQTLSRYCEWTGPDAPVWDADVCCTIDHDGAACSRPSATGHCMTGTKKMYCEHGAATPLGGVTCYQPFPSMCDAGLCIEAPDLIPEAQMGEGVVCCTPGGACVYVHNNDVASCYGELLACNYGISNADGTVDCVD
jgi:hypothetical protein